MLNGLIILPKILEHLGHQILLPLVKTRRMSSVESLKHVSPQPRNIIDGLGISSDVRQECFITYSPRRLEDHSLAHDDLPPP